MQSNTKPIRTDETTYRNVGLVHATLPVDVILAHNPVAVLHPFTALETGVRATLPSRHVGWVVRIQDIDTATGVLLGTSVGRVDLDGVVDSGCRDRGLIWMTWNSR